MIVSKKYEFFVTITVTEWTSVFWSVMLVMRFLPLNVIRVVLLSYTSQNSKDLTQLCCSAWDIYKQLHPWPESSPCSRCMWQKLHEIPPAMSESHLGFVHPLGVGRAYWSHTLLGIDRQPEGPTWLASDLSRTSELFSKLKISVKDNIGHNMDLSSAISFEQPQNGQLQRVCLFLLEECILKHMHTRKTS